MDGILVDGRKWKIDYATKVCEADDPCSSSWSVFV